MRYNKNKRRASYCNTTDPCIKKCVGTTLYNRITGTPHRYYITLRWNLQGDSEKIGFSGCGIYRKAEMRTVPVRFGCVSGTDFCFVRS